MRRKQREAILEVSEVIGIIISAALVFLITGSLRVAFMTGCVVLSYILMVPLIANGIVFAMWIEGETLGWFARRLILTRRKEAGL
ncbi:hypothetical protein MUP07_00655 [Candidatus Bathyarchaeota archaeon]|nr:hypothetical protein [Candidatus Bathyarchaeota archaeon]